jgi:hypothetical protein
VNCNHGMLELHSTTQPQLLHTTLYSYKELEIATNNFDEKLKLGEGGYGVVYKVITILSLNFEATNFNSSICLFHQIGFIIRSKYVTYLHIVPRLKLSFEFASIFIGNPTRWGASCCEMFKNGHFIKF